MGWFSRFRVAVDVKPAGSGDETKINAAPYFGSGTSRSGPNDSVAAGDRVTEEIKRRQVSFAVRYVAAVRGR